MKITTVWCSLFLLFYSCNVLAQKSFFVTAKEGLFIRSEPGLASKKLGKLPYGSVVYSNDKARSKHGWLKVNYFDTPYEVSYSSIKEDGKHSTGYVHVSYLHSLLTKKYTAERISKEKYDQYITKAITKKNNYRKVTDYKTIQKLLAKEAAFEKVGDGSYQLRRLTTEDGFTHIINKKSDHAFLVAYYPELDILLFEGGHASDISVNVKTGEVTETTGNPINMVESTTGLYRLNGIDHGQGCLSYFFQKREGGRYSYYSNMYDAYEDRPRICEIRSFYWLTDTSFIYRYNDYIDNPEIPKGYYFFGKLNTSHD